MKLISWNVNGLRSCLTKGFLEYVKNEDADVICLQETKLQPEQAVFELEGYHRFWNSADKAGYSGTAVFTRREPLAVTYDFGEDIHRHEGRVITAEYEDFFLVCCYTPNSKDQLARLDYRMAWEDDLREYLLELDAKKPVVYCGDLNVAHQEIDLKNPKTNRKNAGFTDKIRHSEDGFPPVFILVFKHSVAASGTLIHPHASSSGQGGMRLGRARRKRAFSCLGSRLSLSLRT